MNRKLVGIVEAKREGTSLTAVAEQTARYQASATKHAQRVADPPLVTRPTAGKSALLTPATRSPVPARCSAFTGPSPCASGPGNWAAPCARLCLLPAVATTGLRECQVEALRNLDVSLKDDRPRALIQISTGSGKTFTAVSFIYQLIKFAGAKRILFLVDRGNLERQTLQEFQQYTAPDWSGPVKTDSELR